MNRSAYAFTLVELLTTIALIAVLMAILLPALNQARIYAKSIKCQSNLRATGITFMIFAQSNNDLLPPAYTYMEGSDFATQSSSQANGIHHWSGIFVDDNYIDEDVLHCPEFNQGGLAPQNTEPDNLDPGQELSNPGVIDYQSQRCAYTVNEALSPRNRFELNFEGAARTSRLVKTSMVKRQDSTILLTEWARDWRIIAGPDSSNSQSYLPIHGFRTLGKVEASKRYDLNMAPEATSTPCGRTGSFRRINAYDLANNPTQYRKYPARLDWVGRNHQGKKNSKNLKQSNFFYLDGHVESKTIYDTIKTSCFEWGQKVYSLNGNNYVLALLTGN